MTATTETILVLPGDVDRGYVETVDGKKLPIKNARAGDVITVGNCLTKEELDKANEEAAWEEYCEWVATLDE